MEISNSQAHDDHVDQGPSTALPLHQRRQLRRFSSECCRRERTADLLPVINEIRAEEITNATGRLTTPLTAVRSYSGRHSHPTSEKTNLGLCRERNQSANVGDETPICLRPKLSSQNRLLPFS